MKNVVGFELFMGLNQAKTRKINGKQSFKILTPNLIEHNYEDCAQLGLFRQIPILP